MYRKDGQMMEVDEARGLVEEYGELEACEFLSRLAQKALSLPVSVGVTFTKSDAAQTAMKVSFVRGRDLLVTHTHANRRFSTTKSTVLYQLSESARTERRRPTKNI
jgi:hypothetical protein